VRVCARVFVTESRDYKKKFKRHDFFVKNIFCLLILDRVFPNASLVIKRLFDCFYQDLPEIVRKYTDNHFILKFSLCEDFKRCFHMILCGADIFRVLFAHKSAMPTSLLCYFHSTVRCPHLSCVISTQLCNTDISRVLFPLSCAMPTSLVCYCHSNVQCGHLLCVISTQMCDADVFRVLLPLICAMPTSLVCYFHSTVQCRHLLCVISTQMCNADIFCV